MKLGAALARVKAIPSESLVRAACILGLVALPLMVGSVFVPTVWPVLVALSVGQALGTLSFVLYLVAIARDLDIVRRLRSPRRHEERH
ncbi:MAG: hypothetical protein BGO98_05230 [Myxococcales bacterium 68-20]|nr:MAG: hypothetical protein BGO98_05230 [Myxococcales bacterium 68-20]